MKFSLRYSILLVAATASLVAAAPTSDTTDAPHVPIVPAPFNDQAPPSTVVDAGTNKVDLAKVDEPVQAASEDPEERLKKAMEAKRSAAEEYTDLATKHEATRKVMEAAREKLDKAGKEEKKLAKIVKKQKKQKSEKKVKKAAEKAAEKNKKVDTAGDKTENEASNSTNETPVAGKEETPAADGIPPATDASTDNQEQVVANPPSAGNLNKPAVWHSIANALLCVDVASEAEANLSELKRI